MALGGQKGNNNGSVSESGSTERIHPVTKVSLMAFIGASYLINLLYMWKIYKPENAWLPLTKIPPSTAFAVTTMLVVLVFLFVKRIEVIKTGQ